MITLTKEYIQQYIKDNKIDTTRPFTLNFNYFSTSFPYQINSIADDAFEGLTNLESLGLACHHHLTSIRKDAFDDCKILKWLNLDGNQISNIENKLYAPRIEILKLIDHLKKNTLSQTMGQDCDTINHSIPLEKSSKIFEEIGKIRQNRPALHGSARDNFKKIAALWSAYLDTEVTIQDVGFMMAMLKAARHKNGDKDNIDNFVDGANYIALAGEMTDAYLTRSNN